MRRGPDQCKKELNAVVYFPLSEDGKEGIDRKGEGPLKDDIAVGARAVN